MLPNSAPAQSNFNSVVWAELALISHFELYPEADNILYSFLY